MKLLSYGKGGGPDSTVWGFWLIESKALFSVALLCFESGSREAFHSHAFNSYSWVLKGWLHEVFLQGGVQLHTPSLRMVRTRRDTFHKVQSVGRTWVLTFRGPWADTWKEYLPKLKKFVTLKSGRTIVDDIQ